MPAVMANGHAPRPPRPTSKRADIALAPMPDFLLEDGVTSKDLDPGYGAFSLTQKSAPVEEPKTLVSKLLDKATTRCAPGVATRQRRGCSCPCLGERRHMFPAAWAILQWRPAICEMHSRDKG